MEARIEAGFLSRKLQTGLKIGMPHSRPMPGIGKSCHELRITDRAATRRIIYRVDPDAILILEVFPKKTQTTPKEIIQVCQDRLKRYDSIDGT